MITSIITSIGGGKIYANISRSVIEQGEKVTIEVGERQYEKYLGDANPARINLTPYCEAYIGNKAIMNVYENIAGEFYIEGKESAFSVEPLINSTATNLFYRNRGGERGILSKLPYLMIDRNEENDDFDIVLAIVPEGQITRFTCGTSGGAIGNVKDVCIVNLTPSIDEDITSIKVQTTYSNNTVTTKEIPIRVVNHGINTRRLVWLNEVGGIDSWCFEFLRESVMSATSDVFYSSTEGYTRTNRKHEILHTVETRELDDITADVVAYIIASPEVYLWENGELEPIDIVTEECRTYSDNEMSGVQVSYRKRMRG